MEKKMIVGADVNLHEGGRGDGMDVGGLQRSKAWKRSFCILSGCVLLLGFLGCTKDQPNGTGGSNAGGSPSGGSQGKGGSSGAGGTSSTSTTSRPDGTGGSSVPKSDAAVTGGGGAAGGTGGAADAISALETGAPDALATDTAVVVGNPRRMILLDEGNKRIVLLDLDNPTGGWRKDFAAGSLRDIQLIGKDLLAACTDTGYLEIDLKTGTATKTVKGFGSVEGFRRLPNGNTVLGMNVDGVTLQELDGQDQPVAGHKASFPSLGRFRMMRRTAKDTFLLGVGEKLVEANWNKEIVWEMTFPGSNLYVYQGMLLADGTLAVSQGYGSSIMIVDTVAKKILTTIGGKDQPDAATIKPNFYAGFQVLPNGHFVVTNWEGHGGGNGGIGIQLLEYDATGKLVWKWKQDPTLVSSLHNVIVLDGLDTTKLHDYVNGVLVPVTK